MKPNISDSYTKKGMRYPALNDLIAKANNKYELVLATAKRIQDAVAKLSIKHSWSPTGQVTLSFGVACSVPAFGRSPEGLIASADAALYRAKSLGRNRIEVAALA